MLEADPNGWSALIAFFGMISAIGVIVGPIVADRRAKSVKAELAAAAKDVKADLAKTHAAAEATHVLVNGQSEAREAQLDLEKRKNAKLRKQLEDAGIKPEE